jgi:hypothetical protein
MDSGFGQGTMTYNSVLNNIYVLSLMKIRSAVLEFVCAYRRTDGQATVIGASQ